MFPQAYFSVYSVFVSCDNLGEMSKTDGSIPSFFTIFQSGLYFRYPVIKVWHGGRGDFYRPIVIRFTVVNTVFGIVLWIKIENDETSKWYETETNIVVSHILKIRKLNWTSISFELFAHELLIKTDKSIELIIKPKGLLAY